MSGQVSRGSAGEYQADERAGVAGSAGEYQADECAGVAWLSWRVSGMSRKLVHSMKKYVYVMKCKNTNLN